ncbi:MULTISPECIES: PstS family phosphate ABC transporter substrate-binding protein [unclassified Lentimonas]|uniref:PstS family phosphate ABC transporter substrate-binding protein n=1 Tax=unclassified Lentimonas TaxID=2630993 RepID=UPI001325708C|nr:MULTISPECIES: substrate-binding domain-containing protein [unclassified Lentimonas]CAA6677290.1 Phosphate ABC transporter, periplasmic phosphate-binding protein PstS (TC 3.A.1.7.1) [Lentimonas sp. CC4]CAA6686085.1 Phosphate ABC transporter, periplasmic phosphate-binding protein PstS (TC 3.A.1.7.1) [Lentimonas sp. CC6]CAA6691407.1 Phosphate ABC transporter, periplasmic phosphate-binding protein PstS (TC 3.A.1.7.1) [Lentimonas sp. CC10]CAA6693147.1 Phosphate ABC transporter, periplasmic phosph
MLSRLSFFFLAAAVVAPVGAEEIRIAASDLLADFITEPLQVYGAEHTIKFEIDSIGSLPALDQLRSDEIDVAIIAVPENAVVPRDEFKVFPFAYDVAVVAVNESNPIDEMSMARLGGIFGSDEEFNYTSWGDMGLSGWGNRSIKPLAAQTEESISLELFKFSVLSGGHMKTTVAEVKDAEVEELLVSDAASIAIMPRLPKNKKVKALMISSEADGPAFGPTDDNVHYGDYPIRLAFYIIYNARDEARVQELHRVLMSDEIADALRENNLFALPDTVRRKLTIDLDLTK